MNCRFLCSWLLVGAFQKKNDNVLNPLYCLYVHLTAALSCYFQPSVRKQHNAGYKHKVLFLFSLRLVKLSLWTSLTKLYFQGNVRTYYQQFEAQLNQSLIDQKVKEHLGAFRPVGLPFPQLRPGMPGLPPPQMQMPGNPQMPAGAQWVPGMRPPVLPRPMPGLPGISSIENS